MIIKKSATNNKCVGCDQPLIMSVLKTMSLDDYEISCENISCSFYEDSLTTLFRRDRQASREQHNNDI